MGFCGRFEARVLMSPRITISNFRLKVAYGSHMPVLIKTIMKTDGPVLEIGSGFYSTPFLHWACRAAKRELLTLDDNIDFYREMRKFGSDIHKFELIDDWDKFDFSRQWNVAFVDQKPPLSRGKVLARLTHVDYVVVHDTEHRNYDKYGYTDELMKLYKYHRQYKRAYPYTSIMSNKHGLNRMIRW